MILIAIIFIIMMNIQTAPSQSVSYESYSRLQFANLLPEIEDTPQELKEQVRLNIKRRNRETRDYTFDEIYALSPYTYRRISA